MAVEKECRIDPSRCVIGHNTPGMASFMQKHRSHLVPMRNWGGKTTTYC